MKNLEIAKIFREIANILEIKGDNPFRIRAYDRAAQNIEGLSENLEDYLAQDKLREIPGIGADLESKIKEYLATGKIKFLHDLKKTIPQGVLELLDIPGVGPKTAKLLFNQLKIKGIPGLKKAIKNNKLIGLEGIKEKTIENIQKGIELVKKAKVSMSLAEAEQVADEFVSLLKKIPEIDFISTAGSLRRQKETVRDIDILVSSKKPQEVMAKFIKLPPVKFVITHGATKSSVRDKNGTQVDCRVVQEKSIGAALVYFTGSKNFNIKLRQIAIKKGLKVSEYGVFKNDKFVAGRTEEEVLKKLGAAFVEPELREDDGEIELALKNKLPKLVELSDIRGDLHVHSTWSDGSNSIEEMALAARKLGLTYIALTDHSQSLKIANGLSVADLKKKKAEIDKVNKKLKGIRVLFGTEVDIDSNGNLDYSDFVLSQFDLVIGAIHSGFKQSKEQITKRLIKACKNKYVNIIAHPTGRLWGVRDAYEVDFNELFKVAKDTNTYMEINSFPSRLDLTDQNVRHAINMGVKVCINTDSHAAEQLELMKFGISVARRGWSGKDDVINTLSLNDFLKEIKK